MSKRDRAARAKDAAEDVSSESKDELDGREDATSAEAEQTELRPSGKRSSRSRRSSAGASTIDGDTEIEGGSAVAVKERKNKASAEESRNPFVRMWIFLRQVVAELKKVIWPSRRDMIVYTIVVMIFVVILTATISGLDLGFAKLVLLVFG